MTFPLIVLALLAAVGGVLNLDPDGLPPSRSASP
jgi:hypothetical protein